MTERRWLWILLVTGLAVFALSFVNAWIVHDREVRGEGFRQAVHFVGAWRGVGMPVLTIGAVAALLVAALAGLRLAGRSVPAWLPLLGSVLTLGVILAAAVPVSQNGHASTVRLSPGFLLPVGAVLALVMVLASARLTRPPRPPLLGAAAIVVLATVLGAGGRWFGLQVAEGTGRHWAEGSYTRTATDGEPTETMTISADRVTIGQRWAGSWEWSGWTVVIDDDPACPDSRGTYHAHDAGAEGLRFVMVVDTCADGARAADLETGIWQRD